MMTYVDNTREIQIAVSETQSESQPLNPFRPLVLDKERFRTSERDLDGLTPRTPGRRERVRLS